MAVRQPFGSQGHGDVDDDPADADSDPDAEENHGLVPQRIGRHVVRPSEQVHDAAKKDRIEKLKARDDQISQCQKTRDPYVAAKEDLERDRRLEEPHLPVLTKT